jgi:hypothetical protein
MLKSESERIKTRNDFLLNLNIENVKFKKFIEDCKFGKEGIYEIVMAFQEYQQTQIAIFNETGNIPTLTEVKEKLDGLGNLWTELLETPDFKFK